MTSEISAARPQRGREEIEQLLLDPGVIAVVRAQRANQVPPLAAALAAGGLMAVEVTMTTSHALEAIRATREALGGRALVGVGTVVEGATCRAALEAGAEFVVSPICRTELVALAHEAGKPIMLGAYTPTEAQMAFEAGADFVKIFPADTLGPAYLKALRAPLPHLRMVPTGGVDLNTIAAFFKAGAAAVGVGSAMISPALLAKEDWPALTRLAHAYVEAARQARAV